MFPHQMKGEYHSCFCVILIFNSLDDCHNSRKEYFLNISERLYKTPCVFIHSLNYEVGRVRENLQTLNSISDQTHPSVKITQLYKGTCSYKF